MEEPAAAMAPQAANDHRDSGAGPVQCAAGGHPEPGGSGADAECHTLQAVRHRNFT